MALPGIEEARVQYRIAKANAEHADAVLLDLIDRIAQSRRPPGPYPRLTLEERERLQLVAMDLTHYEAQMKKWADEIAFLEET